jgi:acyl dehydratase
VSDTTAKKSLRYDDVEVGDEIPMLEIPLTRTLIVSTAIASRDYQDVHHDPALANEKGSRDIFMNILTTNGLVGRYITDWAGPNAVLKSVKIRLGAPNYPGDTMRITGSVIGKSDGVIEVGLRGANSLGDHVTGTVALGLPDPPIAWRADDAGAATDEAQAKAAKKKAKAEKKKAKAEKKKSKKSKKSTTGSGGA